MAYLILIVVALLSLGVGGFFVVHSIGEKAVAEHEMKQQAEYEKNQAVADARADEEEKWQVNAQANFEAGLAQAQVIEKKIYLKGQDYVRETTVFKNKDCTVPPAGMAILNGARGELQESTIADILGIEAAKPDTAVRIIEAPRVPPEQATKPQPPESGRPPKPKPK